MNAKERSVGRMGLILSGALAVLATGCATHVHQRTVYVPAPVPAPPPPVVEAPPAAPPPTPVIVVPPVAPAPVVVASTPVVVIQSESDFYEPLTPYGRWVVVAGYGRCWVPGRIEAEWRPYSNGYWQRTDAGWYWMSEEPWGWATYHYGRWDWNVQFGWFWVPQTQWSPAWVAWREGGGYVGWAPLRPAVAIGVNITTVNYEPAFASRAYVFVEHRHMMEPVRPKTVVVNNTTIINKTVNITKVSVVNKTVINEGPRPEVIERESGRKIHSVAAREFRHREEAAVAGRDRNLVSSHNPAIQSPVKTDVRTRSEQAPVPRKQPVPIAANIARPASTPETTTPTLPTRPNRAEAMNRNERNGETSIKVRAQTETKSLAERPAVHPIPNRPTPRSVEKSAASVTNPVRTPAAARSDRSNTEQAELRTAKPAKLAPGNPTKSEAKRETEEPKREAKPQLTTGSGALVPSPEVASKRTSPREKSRPTDRTEARADDRGEKRD